MFCSSCGSQNPPQLRFCRACGKPISSAESLAADGDDPLKTRLSIPAEQAGLKSPTPQSGAGDPMATVVGMQAVKQPTASSAPDPFATQVGGGGLNVAQLKELAAKSAANKPQPPASEPDSMATIVGMPAVKLPTNPPASSNAEVDPLKTVVGTPKTPPPPPSSGPDPLATIVGMQAVDAATLAALSKASQPQKAPEAPKQEKPVAEKPKPIEKPILPPPNPDPIELKLSSNAPESSSSNVIIFVVIGIVVVIGIIALVLFMR